MSPMLSTRVLAVQSDRRLVELAVAGHERAFEALARRYRAPLQRYCARLGLPESLAEEVVQHTLLQAWVAFDQGDAINELRPWLYRVAHNATLNAVRRLGAGGSLPLEAIPHARVAVEHDAELRMAMRDTLAQVSELPPLQRDAIVLSAIEGRSREEVASALGVTDGAVRGLLYRARVALRGAAAALTPGPLTGWALGTSGHVAPTAARLAELSTPGTDAGAAVLLAPGLAIGATAVLAVGAVVGPLHGGHARARGAAAAQSRPAVTALPSGDSGKRLRVKAGELHAPGAVTVHRHSGGVRWSTPFGGGSARRAPGAEGAGGAGGGSSTGAALRSGQPEAAHTGSVSGSGPGSATASGVPPANDPKGVPQGDAAAPQAPTPPSESQKAGPEREQPGEHAREAAEAASEQRERAAEKAREVREEEDEAAHELKEREEETARELREREAEAARERKGD